MVEAREEVTFAGRDRTGRHPPWTIFKLGGWSPPWGRRDALVYFFSLPVLFLMMSFAGELWSFFSTRLELFPALGALIVSTVALPFAVGCAVSMSPMEARLSPRYLGVVIDVFLSRRIAPASRSREPRGRVVARGVVLPPLSVEAPGADSGDSRLMVDAVAAASES